jgi:transposase
LAQRLSETELLVAQLKVQIAWLKRKTYSVGKSEAADHTQLMLELGKLEAQLAALEAPKKKLDECRAVVVRAKRPLPSEVFAKLPVAEVQTITPEEVEAEPAAYRQIGVEVTTILDIVPPKLIKKEIHRLKFQRLDDKALAPVVAAVPVRMVPGGYASAGLIAYIVILKYLRHLPLYRIEQMSVEWGAQLPRQSMVDWVRMAAEWTEVIYNRMLKELKEGNYIQLDETPIQYCDPDAGAGKTGLGYLWAVSHPQGDVVFDWRLSRRHGELTKLIGSDYKGLILNPAIESAAGGRCPSDR